MRRVRKNDENHRFCEHVSFFLVFDNKKEIMSRSQKLLQEIHWEIKHNREKIGFKKQRLYELQTGILKFCIGVELFQHAWKSEELAVLCQNLFAYVKNTLGESNFVSQIEVLESEIDKAIICLRDNKISSKKLRLFRVYLEKLRNGCFTPPEAYKPKQVMEGCL